MFFGLPFEHSGYEVVRHAVVIQLILLNISHQSFPLSSLALREISRIMMFTFHSWIYKLANSLILDSSTQRPLDFDNLFGPNKVSYLSL